MTTSPFTVRSLVEQLIEHKYTVVGIHAKVVDYQESDDPCLHEVMVDAISVNKDGMCTVIPHLCTVIYLFWQPEHGVLKINTSIGLDFISSSDSHYDQVLKFSNELPGRYPEYQTTMSVYRESDIEVICGLFSIAVAVDQNCFEQSVVEELTTARISRMITRLCVESDKICAVLKATIAKAEAKRTQGRGGARTAKRSSAPH